jgi:hypothetical protein
LTLVATGDPEFIVACHCRECQRRTGSAFGVGAYYLRTQVQSTGAFNIYVRDARDGRDGRKLRFHFCPKCASTVFWELDFRPNHVAVAVGAMSDPHFAAPTRSVWEESRHSWITFDHDISRFPQQSSPPAK